MLNWGNGDRVWSRISSRLRPLARQELTPQPSLAPPRQGSYDRALISPIRTEERGWGLKLLEGDFLPEFADSLHGVTSTTTGPLFPSCLSWRVPIAVSAFFALKSGDLIVRLRL